MSVRRSLLGAAVVWTFVGSVASYASNGEELIRAARQGDLSLVTTLLAQGADVPTRDTEGNTALMLASAQGHREVVTVLLAQGADVNAKGNDDGSTALMLASAQGHREVVTALLAQGADVNTRLPNGLTALMWASAQGHREVVTALLAQGADVNARNSDGGTALLWASTKGHSEVVTALLAQGADVNARTPEGVTALMTASAQGYREVVTALLAQGADVNAKDSYGGTALLWAAANDYSEVAQLLKEAGASEAKDVQRPMNVILISMDTTRPDHLSCYGYHRKTTPNIDRIAQEGTIFTRAFCQAPWTVASHFSLFTSRYPSTSWFDGPWPDSSPEVLTTVLKRHGYLSAAFTGFPDDPQLPYTRAFDFSQHGLGFSLTNPPRRVYDFIERAKHGENPFFLFLHGHDAHAPHVVPITSDPKRFSSEYQGDLPRTYYDLMLAMSLFPRMEGDGVLGNQGANLDEYYMKRWSHAGPEDLDQMRALYDVQIHDMDHGLGRIFMALENLNLMQNTLIVIISDHGESFGEHGKGNVGHGDSLYDEATRMVLIVKDPRGPRPSRSRIDTIVQGVDVMPTILELLDIPVPDTAQGRSLVSLIRTGRDPGRAEHAVSFLGSSWLSFRTKDWKLIIKPDGRGELYRISRDPHERRNVINRYPSVASRLQGQLEEIYPLEAGAFSGLDPETWIQEHGYW